MTAQSRPAVPFVVLLTRPQAQNARFAAEVQGRFGAQVRVVGSPVLEPVFLSPALPERPWQAVVFTSETGVMAARALNRPLPDRAFCVGDRTAGIARANGFQAISANGDADALFQMLLAQDMRGPILYLHGREIRGDLAQRLNSAGIETISAVIYAQEALPLTPEATHHLQDGGVVLIPLFSPRTARLLSAPLSAARASLWIAALSPAVAEPVAHLATRLSTALHPDAEGMLEAMQQLLHPDGESPDRSTAS